MDFIDNGDEKSHDTVDKASSKRKDKVVKGKKTITKAATAPRKPRKAVKKKPDDMPRRPLSAYNYFFSAMRATLVAERAEGKASKFQEFLDEQVAADVNKKNAFFSNMGKFVARRWKELSSEQMKPYTDKADADLERYRKEMDEYRENVARKTRLASEVKLREQEAIPHALIKDETSSFHAITTALSSSSSSSSSQPMGTGGALAGGPFAQNAAMPAPFPGQQAFPGQMGNLMHPGFGTANVDPMYQFLLRQQLLGAQNPQLQSLVLQQQYPQVMMGAQGFGGLGMPPGFQFPPYGTNQMMFGQQQQQQQQQPPGQDFQGGIMSAASGSMANDGIQSGAGQSFPGAGLQQQQSQQSHIAPDGQFGGGTHHQYGFGMMGGEPPPSPYSMVGIPSQGQNFPSHLLGFPGFNVGSAPSTGLKGTWSPQQQQQPSQNNQTPTPTGRGDV